MTIGQISHKKTLLAVAVALVFLSTYLWWSGAITSARLIISLRTPANCKLSHIRLSTILPENSKKLCVQTPYMQQPFLEREAGFAVSDFEEVDDTAVVWWILSENEAVHQMKVTKFRFGGVPIEAPGKTCYDIAKTDWVYGCESGREHYYLEEAK